MTYLFIFAHPDDETVACAGTIRKLIEQGEEVIVVNTTDGSAGEISDEARNYYGDLSEIKIRKIEFEAVMDFLGVERYELLNFKDGEINNKMTWIDLTEAMVQLLLQYKPDIVVTFDHTGWYYHLDHVATSLAVTRAFFDERTHVKTLLYSHFRPIFKEPKWKYKYPPLPVTHQVLVDDVDFKLQACRKHLSQDLSTVTTHLEKVTPHYELYEFGFGVRDFDRFFVRIS